MMLGTSSFLLILMVGGTGSGQRERLYTAKGLVEGGGKGGGVGQWGEGADGIGK